ncbi:rhodopsin-like [Asterias amurensis]|uniref:rhodopsin-like n=1 Tax=Asterias amurensis TaxID=7602 RepID=UPI003AB66634
MASIFANHSSTTNSTFYDEEANLTWEERVFFAVLFSLMAAVSVIGNSLAFLTLRKIKMQASALLINLTIGDIGLGGFVMTTSAITLIKERWVFGEVACSTIAFIKAVSIFSSNMTLCMIALDRFIFVKSIRFSRKTRERLDWFFLLFPWVWSGLSAVGPLVGWGKFSWAPTRVVCTIDWLHSPSYTLACFTCYGFIPNIFILACYLQILRYVCVNKKRLHKSRKCYRGPRSNEPSTRSSSVSSSGRTAIRAIKFPTTVSREEIGVLKTAIVVVLVFFTMAIPYVIIQLISLIQNHEIPLRIGTISTVFVFFGSCLNPFIYSGGNVKFRIGLKKVIMGFICKDG